jgi:predicted SAM-dependent methyltransferase
MNRLEFAARALAKHSLSTLNRPIAQWRFRRAVRIAGGPLLVSVGAGQRRLDGWLNTDISWQSRLYLDISKPWPVGPGSIARIYGDNVIEHFPIPLARRILRYAFDALQPNGRIRLATPDVEATARAYLHDPALTAQHLERHRRQGYDVYYPVDLLRVTFSECGHHLGFCYDSRALYHELHNAGFVDVERFAPGSSNDVYFRGLELRLGPSESATALVVEARKPAKSAAVAV